MPKQMCYCLTGVDVVKWFCSRFLLNGNICVVPSMIASEQRSAVVLIENRKGTQACSTL